MADMRHDDKGGQGEADAIHNAKHEVDSGKVTVCDGRVRGVAHVGHNVGHEVAEGVEGPDSDIDEEPGQDGENAPYGETRHGSLSQLKVADSLV